MPAMIARPLLATLGLAFLALAACSPKDPNNPRFVAAKVNGEKITRAQVDERVAKTLAQMRVTSELLDESILARLRWRDLQDMIEEKLILKEGAARKLEGLDADVQKRLEVIKAKFPSEEAFKKGLQESGMTEEEMRGKIRLSLTLQKLVEEATREAPPVAEAELQEAYQTNPNYSQRPELVKLQHIFQAVPEGTAPEEKARKKAVLDAALKRLKSGEPFEALVAELSEDTLSKNNKGALPPLQRGQAPPEFEKVVFAMKDNELSPVFASRSGWHVVRMVTHQKAETLTYEQAKAQIEVDLLIQKRAKCAETILGDLRKKAKVEVFLPEPGKEAKAEKTAEEAPASPGS